MTAERSLLDHQREASAAKNAFAAELERRRLLREGWTEECLDSERRFGSREARLYPLISHDFGGTVTNVNAVVTPMGPGTLLQVFSDTPARPGAMVMHLRPRAFIEEKGQRRGAAVFVAVEDVRPYRRGDG